MWTKYVELADFDLGIQAVWEEIIQVLLSLRDTERPNLDSIIDLMIIL